MKRKHGESETDYFKRKLRRIEKKLKKLHTGSAEPPQTSSRTPSPSPPPPPSTPPPPPSAESTSRKTSTVNPEESYNETAAGTSKITTNNEDLVIEHDELPEEFLLALGNEGEEKKERGLDIQSQLANRWEKIMSMGLEKEAQQQILKKYPAPNNFRMEAPKINPEITASLSEISLKRDLRIKHRQNLTLKAMGALGKTLTSVLKGNINSSQIIENVNDAAKLCCQIFYEDSSSRKFFALAGANQTIKEAVRDAKPDEFLFGKDCPEKIRAAQAIKKTATQIKVSETSTNKNPIEKQQHTKKRQGNWRGPPLQQHQHQRQRGGHRQAPSTRKYQPHQRDQKRNPHRGRHTYRR